MEATKEMPRYKCHKEVWALKIAKIDHNPNPDETGRSGAASFGAVITPEDDGYAPFGVTAEYVMKHNPQPGGYYVVYADGYQSFSPAKAFEDGYTRTDNAGQTIEAEIQAKGLTAARVTPADIEANIASIHFFIASDAIQHERAVHEHKGGWYLGSTQLLTICVIQMRNGFTVTGESACASPENFDAELGRKIARDNAVQKIWPLMGYALKELLAICGR